MVTTPALTNALFALEVFGAQWVNGNQLLMVYTDPIVSDAFVIYTIKKAAYGSIDFTRHVVTIIEGEYTCNCEAYRYRRHLPDFTDKHIAAALAANELQPEPAAIYQQWKKYNADNSIK
jgi:hypothetical protein